MLCNSKVAKRFLRIVGVLLAIFATARLCHHATRGFCLSKVQSNLCHSRDTTTDQEAAFVDSLFAQKFHFLGRGLQSFVFLSEDGQYVLKLFNNRYQRKIHLFSLLSHLPLVSTWSQERVHYYQTKLAKTFASYTLAFDAMQEKTGLLYLHLRQTSHLTTPLTVEDPLHICHTLDPNHTGFLIQKKATLVYPTLTTYLEQRDMPAAQQALTSLIELFVWKGRHGIDDNDPLIRTNYGFIDGRAIQIDVGPLSRREKRQNVEEQKAEIEHITTSLKNWLNENAPELTPFLDLELHRQLSLLE